MKRIKREVMEAIEYYEKEYPDWAVMFNWHDDSVDLILPDGKVLT